MNDFFFIYQLANEIKVLTYDEAKDAEQALKELGWKHIETLSAREFIKWHYENPQTPGP